jgi:hypothetical protein
MPDFRIKLKGSYNAHQTKKLHGLCKRRANQYTMKNLILILASALALTSCSKKIDELAEYTQTGEMTFGAKVNGANWAPQDFGIVPTGPILQARFAGNNSIIINANDFSKQPSETEFEIYLRDVNGAGVYQLNQSTSRHPYGASASYGYYVQRKLHPLNEWMTGPNAGGTVTITKWDPTTKILAGHFQFQAANMDNPSDVLSVTEGRFDLIVE